MDVRKTANGATLCWIKSQDGFWKILNCHICAIGYPIYFMYMLCPRSKTLYITVDSWWEILDLFCEGCYEEKWMREHCAIWRVLFHLHIKFECDVTVFNQSALSALQPRFKIVVQLNWVQVGTTKCDLNAVQIADQRWTRHWIVKLVLCSKASTVHQSKGLLNAGTGLSDHDAGSELLNFV